MRRYLPSILFLFVLLVAGGSAVYFTSQPSYSTSGLAAQVAKVRGYYVPTFTLDAQGQTMGLIFVGSVVGILVLTIGLGAGLAIAFNQFTKVQLAPTGSAQAAPRPPAERASKSGAAPSVFLSDQRSLTIFWVSLIVLGIALMVIRYWGKSLGTLPGLSEMANMKVFRLPGEHIEGLPPFIAGPGDDVTGLQLVIGMVVGTIVGTAVVSFALARAFTMLDERVKMGDKLPQTALDDLMADLLAVVERRKPVGSLAPARGVDRALLTLDVILVLVIVALVGSWMVSNRGAAAVVSQPPRSASSSGQGGGELDALKGEFASLPGGNPEAGNADFAAKGCSGCHSLEAGVKIVGPSLKGVVGETEKRRAGYPPEIYFYESVTRPSAFIVPGFQDGLMPKDFKETLTPQELADVIAFLMTRK
ncbi:MAG TPA: cytochrome c [Anaerolineales bacterium]|nr:cytochrome c [Anaerolineales bacterium]